MATVTCGRCGTVLGATASPTTVCPSCQEIPGLLAIDSGDALAVTLREKLKKAVRHGPPGKVAPHLEQVVGDDLHRDSGRWMRLERIIDREEDRYVERITDPETGQAIKEVEEPLREHRRHGSDKRRPDQRSEG